MLEHVMSHSSANHFMCMTDTGSVLYCGFGYEMITAIRPKNLKEQHLLLKLKIRQIACGLSFTVVLTQNKKLLASGRNHFGQLCNGNKEPSSKFIECSSVKHINFKTISVGLDFGGGIEESGKLILWGCNWDGQLCNGESGEGKYSCVGVEVKTSHSFSQLNCGAYHFGVVSRNKQFFTAGWGIYGQLGSGLFESSDVLVRGYLNQVTHVACGWKHTVVVSDGKVFAFGNNEYGQVGDGTKEKRCLPAQVKLSSSLQVQSVAASAKSSFCVAGDDLFQWGHGVDKVPKKLCSFDHRDQLFVTKQNYFMLKKEDKTKVDYMLEKTIPVKLPEGTKYVNFVDVKVYSEKCYWLVALKKRRVEILKIIPKDIIMLLCQNM